MPKRPSPYSVSSAYTPVTAESGPPGSYDIICFSHLRWDFVFQRPQHLLTRFAQHHRVFYFEEPIGDADSARLDLAYDPSGVVVAVPHVRADRDDAGVVQDLRGLVNGLLQAERIQQYVAWYYTPIAREFSAHLTPSAIVYDCMDELSGFAGAPAGLKAAETRLLQAADVVFTGGQSLFEAKRRLHPSVHACPSSVEVAHFARARKGVSDPADQANIAGPRAGFYGVIDERLDIALLDGIAALRPDWQFVMLGPIVKIDPATLPQRANIHYLGGKSYGELPDYIAGWSVALLPFARNDATRFISPTKTPEYLAAGRPVVSTSIRDVVHPYQDLGLVRIADTPAAFAAAIDEAFSEPAALRLAAADRFLAQTSWDATWRRISGLINQAIAGRRAAVVEPAPHRAPTARPAAPIGLSASSGTVA